MALLSVLYKTPIYLLLVCCYVYALNESERERELRILNGYQQSQKNGIATLLKAEKEAHEIVTEARKYRQEKIKQAKLDASKEIENYKAKKEQELKDFESNNAGGVQELEKKADAEVQSELDEIKKTVESKKKQVVDLLLEAVTKPTTEVHINAN